MLKKIFVVFDLFRKFTFMTSILTLRKIAIKNSNFLFAKIISSLNKSFLVFFGILCKAFKDLLRLFLAPFRADNLPEVLLRLALEPKPDAGVLGEAGFLGGVRRGVRGDFRRPLLFDGMINNVAHRWNTA